VLRLGLIDDARGVLDVRVLMLGPDVIHPGIGPEFLVHAEMLILAKHLRHIAVWIVAVAEVMAPAMQELAQAGVTSASMPALVLFGRSIDAIDAERAFGRDIDAPGSARAASDALASSL